MDDLLDVLVEICWVGFVSRPEVENTSRTFAAICAVAATAGELWIDAFTYGCNEAREVLSAEREVRLKNHCLWAWNAKRSSVHLFSRQDEIIHALR